MHKQARYIVIGSGPSGATCAAALLEAGAQVTVVDIGKDLTAASKQRLSVIATKAKSLWSPEEKRWLLRSLNAEKEGLPLKSLFGEDFMYARGDIFGGALPHGFAQWPGQAVGGFSRVWGATRKRFDAPALAGWPVTEAELAPHYQAAEALLPARGPAMSHQAAALLESWDKAKQKLETIGAKVEPAQLAVSSSCILCGMCLYGCPYGYIFSSDQIIHQYETREAFSYLAGVKVEKIREAEGSVILQALRADGTSMTLSADRVFVAAGVIATARLLLASFGGKQDRMSLLDGQYFLLPFLTRDFDKSASHALSQIFIELKDEGKPVHVQLYTRNDIYGRMLAAPFGRFSSMMRVVTDLAGRHVVLAQGYLPSSLSGSAELMLDGDGLLQITPRKSERTRPALQRVLEKLATMGKLAGLHAILPLARQTEIGRGYHSGATIPMGANSARWHSDIVGRPLTLRRVHVVDASVWPDIPSGPVTLTAMANAHRIGANAAALDNS